MVWNVTYSELEGLHEAESFLNRTTDREIIHGNLAVMKSIAVSYQTRLLLRTKE